MRKVRFNRGFTLVELLVIISIIGFLASIVLISLNNARLKSRDAKRVADVRQFISALELYQNQCFQYPVEATAITLGATGALKLFSGTPADCGDDSGSSAANGGFGDTSGGTAYISSIPTAPLPADTATCQAGTANDYRYTSATGSTYTITFCLGGNSTGFTAGIRTASPTGIS